MDPKISEEALLLLAQEFLKRKNKLWGSKSTKFATKERQNEWKDLWNWCGANSYPFVLPDRDFRYLIDHIYELMEMNAMDKYHEVRLARASAVSRLSDVDQIMIQVIGEHSPKLNGIIHDTYGESKESLDATMANDPFQIVRKRKTNVEKIESSQCKVKNQQSVSTPTSRTIHPHQTTIHFKLWQRELNLVLDNRIKELTIYSKMKELGLPVYWNPSSKISLDIPQEIFNMQLNGVDDEENLYDDSILY